MLAFLAKGGSCHTRQVTELGKYSFSSLLVVLVMVINYFLL